MADAEFKFRYHPQDGSSVLDAYDASQALYGIARSLSILTHYVVNGEVIKQAPALKNARVLVEPPRLGSFEFIVPILAAATDPSTRTGAVVIGLTSTAIYNLTTIVYNRLAGKAEQAQTEPIKRLVRERPGEIDALSDSIEEDIIRIQRPIVHNVNNITITGGSVNIANLNHLTYEFAKTKVLGDLEEDYIGHVTSFNGSTIQGRFWVDKEERTVGFSRDRKIEKFPPEQRRLLSGSLNEWVTRGRGQIIIRGIPLTSKQGLLKQIFVRSVRDQ